MDVGTPFITHTQPAELMKPCDGALHHPAQRAQPAVFVGSSRRKQRCDATNAQVHDVADRGIRLVGDGGIRPEQDPYYVRYCRVNFDGSGLVILTEGDGTHDVQFSPDRRCLIDTWSRVDFPPVTELRRGSERPDADRPALVDTIGELESVYELADVVFVGGSLIEHGGQNMLEPAVHDCAVLYGPHHTLVVR